MSKKLTKRDIDSFTYGGGWDVRWDHAIPGFGVRVYPSGKKAYVLSYRQNNRKRLMVLGQTGKVTLDMARDLALQNLGAVASKSDPLQERRKKSAGHSVEKVFDDFLERYAKPKNRSWKEVQRAFNADVIPAIGKKSIHEVTKQDIIKIIDKMADRGSLIMANRTLAHVRKFFNWCVERDLIQNSPAYKLPRPAPEVTRDRVLSEEEIRDIWCACEKEGYPFGSLIQLALLTAQRRTEVATMRWQDIDTSKALWTLQGEFTKNKNKHEVPLSGPVLQILQSVLRFEDCPYVFTTDGKTPFSNFGKAKARLDNMVNDARKENRKNSTIPEWRIHDLRRTAASFMASLGAAPHVIERILNHSSGIISGVAAVYNRYQYADEMRDALEKWGEKAISIARAESL